MIERRHTNRRDFFDEDVPPDVIYELTNAAEQEEASLVQIVEAEHKMVAAELSREAEATQSADQRYQAELEAWTTTDLHRTDGVPVHSIPRSGVSSESEGLIRNFDVAGEGMAAEAEAVKPQPLPDGVGDRPIQPLGLAACRGGATARSARGHPVGFRG